MKTKVILLSLVTVLLFTCPIRNTFAGDIEAGEQIFLANCTACHAGGQNLIIPEKTLEKEVLNKNSMDNIQAITNQVKNGKNAMPAFGGRLGEDDIENVATYVLDQSERGWD